MLPNIMDKNCNCKQTNSKKCSYCCQRLFRDNSLKLSILLGEIKRDILGDPINPTIETTDEKKYKKYNYNGSFHKTLRHNPRDGRLILSDDYEKMKKAIIYNNQEFLAKIPLAEKSTMKLANPLGSLATLLVGAEQGVLKIDDAPDLSSKIAAAEMIELYAKAIARDIPFNQYQTDPIIAHLLTETCLANLFILTNLKYSPDKLHYLSPETIFRGNSYGDTMGPYISQLLLLPIVAGALKTPQKYIVPPSRSEAKTGGFRVEWGVTLQETINLQDGNLPSLPPPTPTNKLVPKYLYSGRSLAEAVHSDPVYQFFYHAALILSSLGAQPNPGWPVYPNQSSFITNNGPGSIQCLVAGVTDAALKHVWYWKWQQSRKLRPETFGLWVHDIKSGLVPNENNFDISNFLLENHVLKDIFSINNITAPNSNSYTLPQSYREGAPVHPAYPSGHATIAGACCTVLKMFFNGEQQWTTVPGIISGALSGFPNALVQANSDGTELEKFNGQTSDITVGGEINKLATNIAFGRSWAGIHYRTDGIQGILLGEKIAIYYMSDILSTMVENKLNGNIPTITFKKFDGTDTTIIATVCKQI